MKIIIFGNNSDSEKLTELTKQSLEIIGLSDFIEIENLSSQDFKDELQIKSDYAFCVEEESIDFKDSIFEGQIPSLEELNSLLISLVGGENSSGCSPDSCSSCIGC